jgi:hypothetical protein
VWVHMLSLCLLTFYCSLSFFFSFLSQLSELDYDYLFFHFVLKGEEEKEEKKNGICHNLYTYLIEWIRKKNSLFWNARRKLARVNSNTLQTSICTCACMYTKQGFWHIYIYIHSYRDSLTWSKCEETKTDNKRKCKCVMACDEVIRIYSYTTSS